MIARCVCCNCFLREEELTIPTEPENDLCDLCLLYGDDEIELKNHEAACAAEDDHASL